MTSIDTVVGTTMKVTAEGTSSPRSSGRRPRGLDADERADPRGDHAARRRRELHLAATDMEISLRVSLDAQVEDEGAVVVPGRLLVDIVRLLPPAR